MFAFKSAVAEKSPLPPTKGKGSKGSLAKLKDKLPTGSASGLVLLIPEESRKTQGPYACYPIPLLERMSPKVWNSPISFEFKNIERLKNNEWVDDNIVDFGIRKVIDNLLLDDNTCRRKQQIHFFPAQFFKQLTENGIIKKDPAKAYDLVKTFSTVNVDIFTKKFLIFPIDINNLHWSLIIIANPHLIYTDDTAVDVVHSELPVIYHLDSLGMHDTKTISEYLQSYLYYERLHIINYGTEKKNRINNRVTTAMYNIKVTAANPIRQVNCFVYPQQNGIDCGIFTIENAKRFINAWPISTIKFVKTCEEKESIFNKKFDPSTAREHLLSILVQLREIYLKSPGLPEEGDADFIQENNTSSTDPHPIVSTNSDIFSNETVIPFTKAQVNDCDQATSIIKEEMSDQLTPYSQEEDYFNDEYSVPSTSSDEEDKNETKLIEETISTIVHVPMIFNEEEVYETFEAAEDQLMYRAIELGYGVKKKERNKRKVWEFRCANCSRSTNKVLNSNKIIRKRSKPMNHKCQWKCAIKELLVDTFTGEKCIKIININSFHNHYGIRDVSTGKYNPNIFPCFRKWAIRKVKPEIKSYVRDHISNLETLYNLNYLLQKEMPREVAENIFDRQSVRNVRHYQKDRTFELLKVQEYLENQDPQDSFDYEFRYNTKMEFKALFLCHRQYQRPIAEQHWTHVEVDSTFGIFKVKDEDGKHNKTVLRLLVAVVPDSDNKYYAVGMCIYHKNNSSYEDFQWMLRTIKTKVFNNDDEPMTIASDRELAMVNGLTEVFSHSYCFLCHVHMKRDVSGWLAAYFNFQPHAKTIIDQMCDDFMLLMEDESYGTRVEAYNSAKDAFMSRFSKLSLDYEYNRLLENTPLNEQDLDEIGVKYLAYLSDTWLPYEKHLAICYMNMHICNGRKEDNAVESIIGSIKKFEKREYSPQAIIQFLECERGRLKLKVQEYDKLQKKKTEEIDGRIKNYTCEVFSGCYGKISHYAMNEMYANLKEVVDATNDAKLNKKPIPSYKCYRVRQREDISNIVREKVCDCTTRGYYCGARMKRIFRDQWDALLVQNATRYQRRMLYKDQVESKLVVDKAKIDKVLVSNIATRWHYAKEIDIPRIVTNTSRSDYSNVPKVGENRRHYSKSERYEMEYERYLVRYTHDDTLKGLLGIESTRKCKKRRLSSPGGSVTSSATTSPIRVKGKTTPVEAHSSPEKSVTSSAATSPIQKAKRRSVEAQSGPGGSVTSMVRSSPIHKAKRRSVEAQSGPGGSAMVRSRPIRKAFSSKRSAV